MTVSKPGGAFWFPNPFPSVSVDAVGAASQCLKASPARRTSTAAADRLDSRPRCISSARESRGPLKPARHRGAIRYIDRGVYQRHQNSSPLAGISSSMACSEMIRGRGRGGGTCDSPQNPEQRGHSGVDFLVAGRLDRHDAGRVSRGAMLSMWRCTSGSPSWVKRPSARATVSAGQPRP